MNNQSSISKPSKKWYKTWWGIPIIVILLPFFLIWYIWAKTNWDKNVKIVVTIIIFLIFVISNISNNPSKTSNNSQPTSTPTSTIPVKKTIQVKPKPIYKFIAETGIAKKTISITDSWNESSLVKNAVSAFVKLGQIAFKNSKVKYVLLECKTEFTDTHGKKSNEIAVSLKMSRNNFKKYNWKNLEYQPIYDQLKEDCDNFYIHPGIFKNLNFDKVYYSPNYQLK